MMSCLVNTHFTLTYYRNNLFNKKSCINFHPVETLQINDD